MNGLLLLLVAAAWLVLTAALAHLVTSRMKDVMLRLVVVLVIVAVLLPLPLIDEFIGERQFKELCKQNATIQIDREKAVGKTVYLAQTPEVEIRGNLLRMVLKPWRFVDVSTGEPVVGYNTLIADGGWLIRHLGVSEGRMPLIFRGTCVPENRPGSVKTFEPFGITYIEPPTAQSGEKR